MIRAALGVALCGLWAGCISTRLEDRDWVQIETSHYEIWSSLGADASTRLAGELERFRTATEFVIGREIPAGALRTRVYAFDDRGIGRPFAHGSERSYLLTRQPGDVIVLRTGGGWEGDAWTPLKLDYARRLIWNASTDDLPPWLDEGLPQLASTLESRSDGALAGVLREDHVQRLRDSQWIPFDRLLGASDLASWSGLERDIFEAETWALCHYLTFEEGPLVAQGALARFQTQVRDGADPGAAARAEFGDLGKLQRDVWRTVRTADIDESELRIRWRGARPAPRPVAQAELLEQLGGLAIAIRNDKLALTYLERAVALGASSAPFLVDLGDALEARGRSAEADERYQAALAAAPDDPLVQLRYANRLRARAESGGDPAARTRLAAAARSHYARSIELDGAHAESHAGYAAIHLLDGQEPAASLDHARTAQRLQPGDPEIGLLSARLELALGDRASARRDAAREITRARSNPELEAARSLLAQIDERASIR
jgi:tetratricopeptide (TPR) repeat protein